MVVALFSPLEGAKERLGREKKRERERVRRGEGGKEKSERRERERERERESKVILPLTLNHCCCKKRQVKERKGPFGEVVRERRRKQRGHRELARAECSTPSPRGQDRSSFVRSFGLTVIEVL